MTRIVVLSAGLGKPSASKLLGDRLADATVTALRQAQGTEAATEPDVQVELIQLREYARDLADNLVTGFPSARLAAAIAQVTSADGLIAVSPIFSASFSGLFKTFIDVLQPQSLAGKPVLIAATGGTARHSLALEHALRPLFAYLRTVQAPTAVFAATEDFGGAALAERIERAGAELAALVGSCARISAQAAASVAAEGSTSAEQGDTAAGADEPEVTPFAELLRRHGQG